MGSDVNYQVVYRGDFLESYLEGGWVLFQRPKAYGGGYWLGRTYDNYFMLEIERPVSLAEGIKHKIMTERIARIAHQFDDDFTLT